MFSFSHGGLANAFRYLEASLPYKPKKSEIQDIGNEYEDLIARTEFLVHNNRPLIKAAHRGAGNTNGPALESTLLAYTLTGSAYAWEADIQFTSDDEPVVFHDTTVDALTSGSGTVASYTLANLQALTFDAVSGHEVFSDLFIPSLDELIEAFLHHQPPYLILELKSTPGGNADIDIILGKIQAVGLSSRTIIYSSFITQLEYIRTQDKAIGVMFFKSTVASFITSELDRLSKLRNAWVLTEYTSIIGNPSFVATAHGKDLLVGIYTIDHANFHQQAQALGTNLVMFDRVCTMDSDLPGLMPIVSPLLYDNADGMFSSFLTGGGTITYSTNKKYAQFTADSSSKAAMHGRAIAMTRGEDLLVRFIARAMDGSTNAKAVLNVITGRNHPGTHLNDIRFKSKHWQVYNMRYRSDVIDDAEGLEIFWGVGTAEVGDVRILPPSFYKAGGQLGVPRIWAMGAIQIDGGGGSGDFTVEVYQVQYSSGIKSVVRGSATEIHVTTDVPINPMLSDTTGDHILGFDATLPVFIGMPTSNRNLMNSMMSSNALPTSSDPNRVFVIKMVDDTGALRDFDALSGQMWINYIIMSGA